MAGQQYAHEDYTIGWICALPKTELVAAKAMLDEEYSILPAADPQDMNSYVLGRIGDHNVVVACLPAETTGKVSAATVAMDMIRSFPSIRVGLMVGIGGGVPRRFYPERSTAAEILEDDFDEWDDEIEEIPDIRLGDVVVSLHTKSAEAVVQYDFGKSLQEKEFVHTGGKLNKPPRVVLTAVSQLQANHIRSHHKISGLLSEMLTNNPAMIRFQHPGMEKDRLFRPDVIHVEGRKTCRDCCGPNNANIIQRNGRSDTAPRIHYGTIGSADNVMKDAMLRDQWAMKENILCFEMEAAGLIDSFPCLVVRGICDYADSHKNKVWQPYAAATAAAYAKELLLVIPGQDLTKLSPIKHLVLYLSEQIEAVNSGIARASEQCKDHQRQQSMRYQVEDQRQCHQVFKTSKYEMFKNKNPDPVEGTCHWALNSSEYLRWWNATSNDLLWISADPGCGKSVLAKYLIDSVFAASSLKISVVYFFFKNIDKQKNLATALCAVLHQLFSLQPQLLRHALPFWEKNQKDLQCEVDDMWRILMVSMSDLASLNTICVFDALDECCDYDQKVLIKKLCDFYKQRPTTQGNWLKFLVTSRPYNDIQNHFQLVTECFPQIHLRGEEENHQIHKEINLVVKVKVTKLRKDLGLRADTQERLERELCEMKHRTHLWLRLAFEDIEKRLENSIRPDSEPIPPLPKGVPEAYERILDRVPSNEKRNVKIILQIIVGARRPLTIPELAIALGIGTTPSLNITPETYLSPKGLDKKIRHLCGLFVFIMDSRIYLFHQTARDFLTDEGNKQPRDTKWQNSIRLQDADGLMSRICVSYLYQRENHVCWNRPSRNSENSIESEAFLDYSAKHWIPHLKVHLQNKTAGTPELLSMAENLCDIEKPRAWNEYANSITYRPYQDAYEPYSFFWAARWGLADVAVLLLQHLDFEITDQVMESAASHCAKESVVMQLLLDHRGEDIKITEKILLKAAMNEYCGYSMMDLLLYRRSDEIEITDHVLQAAAANDKYGLPIIELLLHKKGHEIRITSGVMISAMKEKGNGANIVKCLLERKGNQIRITRRIIRAALTNRSPHRDSIIELLRQKSPYMIKIMRQYQEFSQCYERRARKWDGLVGKKTSMRTTKGSLATVEGGTTT